MLFTRLFGHTHLGLAGRSNEGMAFPWVTVNLNMPEERRINRANRDGMHFISVSTSRCRARSAVLSNQKAGMHNI